MNHSYLFLTLHNRCFIFRDFHKQTICHIPHVRKHFVFYHSEFHSKAVYFLRSRTKFRTRVNRERMRGHPFSISLVRGNRRGGAAHVSSCTPSYAHAPRSLLGPRFGTSFVSPASEKCVLNVFRNILNFIIRQNFISLLSLIIWAIN